MTDRWTAAKTRVRRNLFLRQATSFAGVGVLATFLHYLVLITLVQYFGTAPVPSALLGYCCGGFLSYSLNRRHTFVSDRPHAEAIWRFALVSAVGFAMTFVLMYGLVDRWHLPYLFAQAMTTGIVMVWNFTANRFWTFALMPSRLR